jgi:hypothetical protein
MKVKILQYVIQNLKMSHCKEILVFATLQFVTKITLFYVQKVKFSHFCCEGTEEMRVIAPQLLTVSTLPLGGEWSMSCSGRFSRWNDYAATRIHCWMQFAVLWNYLPLFRHNNGEKHTYGPVLSQAERLLSGETRTGVSGKTLLSVKFNKPRVFTVILQPSRKDVI